MTSPLDFVSMYPQPCVGLSPQAIHGCPILAIPDSSTKGTIMAQDNFSRRQEILNALKDRKHARELQLAQLGVNAVPVIRTELRDIEIQIKELELGVEDSYSEEYSLQKRTTVEGNPNTIHMMESLTIFSLTDRLKYSLYIKDARLEDIINTVASKSPDDIIEVLKKMIARNSKPEQIVLPIDAKLVSDEDE